MRPFWFRILGGILGGGRGILGMLRALGNIGQTRGAGGMIVQGAGLSKGIGGLTGGALLLGGGALAFDGLRRGGFAGLGETIAGGALIGAKFGGPIGALIGAGVGAIAGVARLFIKGKAEKIISKVESIYGIRVSKQFAQSALVPIIDGFGGNMDVGLRSPQARDAIMLYGAATGQQFSGSNTSPHAASLVEQNGSLFQQSSSVFGRPFALQSNLPIAGGVAGVAPAQTVVIQNLSLAIADRSAADFMTQRVVTPQTVQAQFSKAQQSSTGRVQNSAVFAQPGLITG